MNTVYRTGSWHALVGPQAVVLLPPDADAELVTRLWERVGGDEVAFSDVVDAMTGAGRGRFSAIPPFAAVVHEGEDARVAVRGSVRARLSAAGGAVEVSGAEVTTWSERFVHGVTGIEITAEEGGEGVALPIVAGVVRAAALTTGDAPASSPASSLSSPAELPVPEPVPVPELVEGPPSDPVPELVEGPPSDPVPELVEGPLSDPVPELVEGPPAEAVPELVEGAPAEEPAASPGSATDAAPPTDAAPTSDAASTPDALPADEIEDVDDTVLSVPSPIETMLPPADTIAAPLGGHTLDFRPAPAGVDLDGDHDGATISVAQARALRDAGSLPAEPLAAVPTEPSSAVTLDPMPTTAGAAGPRIRLSTGQVIALDRTVVIGRRPRATRSTGATLPHLVAVDSPEQDISRSHLEIRPETDAVVVLDLHTTNGSTLLRPGTDPVRLHPGEQTVVVSGDVIDLGDGVTVAFEDLP